MFASKSIDSQHSDLIHDVQYDFYGRRMATCSSDQYIKVWELKDDQEWHCTARLQGHVGSVWRVAWAHPEFGQVIASCGFDRTIAIWEEINNSQNGQVMPGPSNWVRRSQLVDPRTSVTDIKFAPRHLGMQLASCSIDGMVRLYEAQDVMDLSQWTLQYDFATNITASCLSWSTSPADRPLLVVGNCKPNSANSPPVLIFELGDGQRIWERVEAITNIDGPVHDVAFAPNMGQSSHTFAVAADRLYVFYIKERHDDISQAGSPDREPKYKIEMASGLDGAPDKIWRVCWNVTGTTLASSGEDGTIKFWIRNYALYWQQVGHIQPDLMMPSLPPANEDMNPEMMGSRNSSTNAINCIGSSNTNLRNVSNPVQFHRKAPLPNRNEFVWP